MTHGTQAEAGADERLQGLERRFPPRDLPGGAQVTRVAPSPTGKPHIGTALQATIDYALARRTGGVFILRIEDTDRARLVEGAVEDIIDSLHWLGLPPNEGPVSGGEYGPYVESERLETYQIVANWLVKHGRAYLCFCSPERLAEVRAEQMAARQPTRYDRHCRNLTPEERSQHLAHGEVPVVRLAMPLEGTIRFNDPVRGAIEFDAADQDDPVLLKSDGFPTYHLGAMVDDHFMRVTTAVRGEEWISSTPKHLVLLNALGWQAPRIVHTPLLRDEQGRKLSKRSGDTSISWYRAQGYPPEAFRNFLTRIIWAHPEGKDVYPFDDFVAAVKIDELPNTGPIVNHALLEFISSEWLRTLDNAQLYDRTQEWLHWLLERYTDQGMTFEVVRKQERIPHPVDRERLIAFQQAFEADRGYSERVLSLEPERYHKYGDIVLQTGLYYDALFVPPSPEMLRDAAKGDWDLAVTLLTEYQGWFSGRETEMEWERAMDAMAECHGLKRGIVYMLLRLAITGTRQTPPLFSVIQVLGVDRVRGRIRQVLSQSPTSKSG